MKILYVITRAQRGGAQVHLLDLIAHLPAYCNPLIATGEIGFLSDEAFRLGISVRVLPQLTQPIRPVKDFLALFQLIRLIRRERPDVIHAHTSKAGLLARFAGHLTRTPVVFTAHTWSFAEGLPRFQRLVSLPLERLAASAAGKIITVSEANTTMAVQQSIAGKHAFSRIWNGVPDVAGRAVPGSRPRLTLITAARFAPQKDHMLLLQALTKVRGDWQLLLVGDGPTRPYVQKAAVGLGLLPRVKFFGERNDIEDLLAGADIFVLPSKWEGLPLSILEAMRAGLPVVATDTGGVAEAVTHGVTGYLTPPGDASQLAARIQQLIDSRALLASMGCVGRRRYEQDFRIETMVNKTVAVYLDLVAAKHGPLVPGTVEA